MLNINKISKSYQNTPILENITFNISESAAVYGLLGRNGAGKTTLMKIIYNMISDYRGKITLNNHPIPENTDQLTNIIYVGGEISRNNNLFQGKISHLIKAHAQLYPHFDTDFAKEILARFDISLKQKFSKLSTGNKTLVQNTLGLASQNPVTIMDEPTNGLDSVNRQLFFDYMMQSFEENPRIFILSTHLIQEIEHYLTHVLILKNRQIILDESIESLQEKSFRITNGPTFDYPVIHTDQLGATTIQDIYGPLSLTEIQSIKENGGQVDRLGLQDLFNDLMLNQSTLNFTQEHHMHIGG